MSLLPSATEIVCALGLEDALVGVSHECDYPPTVRGKPVVTGSRIPQSVGEDEMLTARGIDDFVRAARASGESLYIIHEELLRDLKPDLLLTQGLCDVCAVSHRAVVQAVALLGDDMAVLDLSPLDLGGVLHSIQQVGAATGTTAEAELLIESMQTRFEAVRDRAAAAPESPRTLLLGWPDPPFSAGHWNSELLQLAHGTPAPWDVPGEPSRPLTDEEIVAFAPEMLICIGCGLDVEAGLLESDTLPEIEGWYDLPCVRNAEVYVADGSAFFNRPGVRLVESLEILATILHPEVFTEMLPANSVARVDSALLTPLDSLPEAGG